MVKYKYLFFNTSQRQCVYSNSYSYFKQTFGKDLVGSGRYRSSCSLMFFEIGVCKNFANFTRKHLCWSLLFKKLQILRPVTLSKRYSDTGVFQWICEIFKKIYFLQNTCGIFLYDIFYICCQTRWECVELCRGFETTSLKALGFLRFFRNLTLTFPSQFLLGLKLITLLFGLFELM